MQQCTPMNLSPLDQVAVRGWVVLYLFLPAVTDADEQVRQMQDGLDKLCKKIPVLAGELDAHSSRPGRLRVSLRPDRKTVPIWVRSNRDVEFEAVITSHDHQTNGSLFPDTYAHGVVENSFPLPTLIVQAIFLNGGCTLSVVVHHSVFDGIACGTIVELLAASCAGREDERTDSLMAGARSPRVSIDPMRMSVEDAEKRHGSLITAKQSVQQPQQRKATSKFCRLPAGRLATLESEVRADFDQAVTSDRQSPQISRLDIVTAFIWQCVLRARAPLLTAHEPCILDIACDGRARMVPQMPAGYLGNCGLTATSTIEDVAAVVSGSIQLAELAAMIRASYRNIDASLLHARMTLVEAERDLRPLLDGVPVSPNRLVVTSWTRIPPKPLDFGEGLGCTVHARSHLGYDTNGILKYQPFHAESGDLDFYLGLECETWDRLENDPMWNRYIRQE